MANGYGPGTGGNASAAESVRLATVSARPAAIFQPEAEFSDEARRAKYEGTVVVTLIVDANGNPQNVHVSRTLGMGLDEKAVEAVQKYKFKPAVDQKTGKPVPVMVSVEVRFNTLLAFVFGPINLKSALNNLKFVILSVASRSFMA